MKSFCLKILILILVVFASSQKLFGQEIKFKESKQNFGFVHEGDTVRLSYELKNIGNQPLIISNYEVECGCTKMESVNIPIQPGASYILKVSFDTHEKYDRQDRTLKIISNAKNSPTELRFKGVVLKPKKK
ncbi:MAG: DUF1573 domain-containing protein [Bacteroidetes bacterium]|nr:DUF1573 domain-containing protein [Bacteroidota bacterium]